MAADEATRPAICALLCQMYLSDGIPETVVHDCLEQLLWNVSAAQPSHAGLLANLAFAGRLSLKGLQAHVPGRCACAALSSPSTSPPP